MTNITNEQLEAWAGLGPWEWSEETICRQIYHFLGPGVLVTTETDGTPWGDTIDKTNAALIAAAPDLARLVLEKDAEIARLKEALELAIAANCKMKDALSFYADDGPTPNVDGPWKATSWDFGAFARCTLADVANIEGGKNP